MEDAVSRPTLESICKEMNWALCKRKKDQCSECTELKINQKDVPLCQTEHFIEKDKANAEKTKIKTLHAKDNSVLIFSMDVQQAQPVPKLEVDAAFFRNKMLLHNFTMFNMKTKAVKCYIFTEQDATGKAEVYAWCVKDYVLTNIEENPGIREVHIFSDNCGAQNKNGYLSNLLLHMALTHELTIFHHYLVRGHTHMEVDSFHSAVETRVSKQELHTVEDYVQAMESALDHSKREVTVRRLQFHEFEQWNFKYIKNARPGSKVGDPTVNDVRCYKYTKEGEMLYKLKVDDVFTPMPHKIHKSCRSNLTRKACFDAELSLSETKRKHMEELSVYIPLEKRETFRAYYQ
jgi:hypothetical protein